MIAVLNIGAVLRLVGRELRPAAVLLAAIIVRCVLPLGATMSELTPREVIDHHLRSLTQNHLTDVLSSNQRRSSPDLMADSILLRRSRISVPKDFPWLAGASTMWITCRAQRSYTGAASKSSISSSPSAEHGNNYPSARFARGITSLIGLSQEWRIGRCPAGCHRALQNSCNWRARKAR